MQPALDRFAANIARVRDLHGIYVSIRASTTAAVDLGDLLRAEIVLAISAFDSYVHDLTSLGMLEIFAANRAVCPGYSGFKISMEDFAAATMSGGSADWFRDSIREAHGFLTFQSPEKVANAIRLFSEVRLWEAVGARLGEDAGAVRARLSAIVDRRNKIAHEADIDPTNPPSRWPIDEAMANEAVNAVEQIGRAVFDVVS